MSFVKVNPDNLFVSDDGIVRYVRPGGTSINVITDTTATTQNIAAGRNVKSGTADVTLTATNSGRVHIQTSSSGTQTYTLPVTTALSGAFYTFICANASGEIRIVPNSADTISIKASEGGASVVTAAGAGIKNTAATNVVGDHITLVSDGVSQWVMVAQSGTWAAI